MNDEYNEFKCVDHNKIRVAPFAEEGQLNFRTKNFE